jgi:23S rRNA pseudouridine1911/1915/1917 synthase
MSDRQVEFRVPASAAGQRLDRWLTGALEGSSSRAQLQRLLDSGQVLVDGRRRPKGFTLSGGEQISADLAEHERRKLAAAIGPRIAWEDDHLMIVDKPAGLVVHPAPGHPAQTLVELLAAQGGSAWSPYVVHRLDKNTSGLMVVAKRESIQQRLRDALRRREMSREYLALVNGQLDAKSGTIDAPIGRDLHRRTRISTRTAKPRSARTHFTVERFLDDYTLVRARLDTGRTHQVRAHFAALGHPISGDPEYGGAGVLGLGRQFLHSARLAFPHPETGLDLDETSPLPDDLAAALARAGQRSR